MGRDLSVTVGPGVGHLTDFAFPGKGLFEPVFRLTWGYLILVLIEKQLFLTLNCYASS